MSREETTRGALMETSFFSAEAVPLFAVVLQNISKFLRRFHGSAWE